MIGYMKSMKSCPHQTIFMHWLARSSFLQVLVDVKFTFFSLDCTIFGQKENGSDSLHGTCCLYWYMNINSCMSKLQLGPTRNCQRRNIDWLLSKGDIVTGGLSLLSVGYWNRLTYASITEGIQSS